MKKALAIRRGNTPSQTERDPVRAVLAGLLSPETKRAYAGDLQAFGKFLGGLAVLSVTPDHVAAWRDAMLGEGFAPATVARRLSTVRSVFDRLILKGFTTRNPADSRLVPSPKVGSESTTPNVTATEVRKILAATEKAGKKAKRDRALVSLLAYCGLRRAEATSLTLASFVTEEGIVRVAFTGKGQKRRAVSLRSEVLADVRAYIAEQGLPDVPLARPLAEDVRLFALTTDAVWRIVRRTAKRAGIASPIRPHSFRRAAIQSALDHGASLRGAQDFAGHASPTTTARYDRERNRAHECAGLLVSY